MENKIAGWNDQYPWFDCEGRIDLVHFFFLVFPNVNLIIRVFFQDGHFLWKRWKIS